MQHLISYGPSDSLEGLVTNKGAQPVRRHKMGNAQSKKHFTRNAMRVHPKNAPRLPMRGGIRL